MRKNLLFFLSLFHFLMLTFCSCGDSNTTFPDNEKNDLQPKDVVEIISQSASSMDYKGGTIELTIKSMNNWTASLNDEAKNWCSITPNSGEAGISLIKIVMDEYDAINSQARTVNITIKSGSDEKVLELKQNCADDRDYYAVIGGPDGFRFNSAIKSFLLGEDYHEGYYMLVDSLVRKIEFQTEVVEFAPEAVEIESIFAPVYAKYEKDTGILQLSTSAKWFSTITNDLSYMFSDFWSLECLDLSNIRILKPSTMKSMFRNCGKLKEVCNHTKTTDNN